MAAKVPNYIRVKRLTSTYFICVSAKDTIARVKDVLCNTILNGDKVAEEVRLYIQKPQGGYTLLEDALQVEKAGLENDMLVYLTYYDQDQGQWEDIQVSQPEELDDGGDDEDDVEDQTLSRKEKGKSKA
ncbi:hypothetical protein INT44_004149 [Umbelopsis vinacea]|uniref:Ubiquitin-like domain-containing protein n=1 Tax=Umbelopsis vinacea TaxID=44442 RepID=A0A8H7UP80_9FUNG|nr:hypothetical protein INT44_004149 [Umbelopsis vinacea]KAI9287094.1 hypothetical protein BC943DRAFT_336171 [Umbelopsis sp. AD052]